MPRRPHLQDTAALEEGKAALDQSLKAVNARLRQEKKAAWARRNHELAARRRHVQQAVAVLLLHDSDRCWLPAFMRKHGMSDVAEELAAFDEEVVNHFLGLSVEDMNAMRTLSDQQGKARLREAQAFLTEEQLQAWVARQNEFHGIAPTVGDTLKHRDELAAATQVNEMDQPAIWSLASSARYKWSASFRKRWRLGVRKPHAREAVPLEIARQKAVPLGGKGQTPSLFSWAKCFVFVLFAFSFWPTSYSLQPQRCVRIRFPIEGVVFNSWLVDGCSCC